MKRFGKKAQIFLLAAVIISVVVIGLGVTVNQANVKEEPNSFKDFTYEVKKETGAVIDFEVYSGFEHGAKLTDFVRLLAKDIKDKDPNANFLFLYGNNTNMTLKNYGRDRVATEGETTQGSGREVPGRICYGNTCIVPVVDFEDFDPDIGTKTYDFSMQNKISVEAFGQTFNFSISEHRQVIFIIQKSVGDENYVFVR